MQSKSRGEKETKRKKNGIEPVSNGIQQKLEQLRRKKEPLTIKHTQNAILVEQHEQDEIQPKQDLKEWETDLFGTELGLINRAEEKKEAAS